MSDYRGPTHEITENATPRPYTEVEKQHARAVPFSAESAESKAAAEAQNGKDWFIKYDDSDKSNRESEASVAAIDMAHHGISDQNFAGFKHDWSVSGFGEENLEKIALHRGVRPDFLADDMIEGIMHVDRHGMPLKGRRSVMPGEFAAQSNDRGQELEKINAELEERLKAQGSELGEMQRQMKELLAKIGKNDLEGRKGIAHLSDEQIVQAHSEQCRRNARKRGASDSD